MAMVAIMSGKRPSRPNHPALTDQLWTLIQGCWEQDPHLRPEVSEALQALLAASVSHPFRGSSIRELDGFLVYSDLPAWKQLLSPALATHKRIPLIMTIFSGSDEVEIARNLFGDDAQTFVDVIDEVSIRTFHLDRTGLFVPYLNFCALPVSHWITSRQGSTGGVCILYTGFVVERPYFRDH